MATRARLLQEPTTVATDANGRPAFDPSKIHTVTAHPDKVTVPAFFVHEHEATAYSQGADIVVGELGAPRRAAEILLYDAKTTIPAFKVLDDGRIVVCTFKKSNGKGNKPSFYPWAKPPKLAPGDRIRAGRNTDGALPRQQHVMATQFNIEASVGISKGKKPKTTLYWQGSDIVEVKDGGINFLPVEERYAYAMPYETQLLPRVLGLTDEEYEEEYVIQAYTQENLPEGFDPRLALPFDVQPRCVRLPVNRFVRDELDMTKAWAAPFIVPDEGAVHDFGRTTKGGAAVCISNKRIAISEHATTKKPKIEMTLRMLIEQQAAPGEPWAKHIISNLRIFGDRFLVALGVGYAPLLNAILESPTAAFGSLPFDIIFRPNVREARTTHLNVSEEEQRVACYADGDVPGEVEEVVARMCENAFYRGIPVSLDLVRARMDAAAIEGEDHAFVPGDMNDWLKSFMIGVEQPRLPPAYQAKNYTLDRNPGFVIVDMLDRPRLEGRTDKRYFMFPAFDLTDEHAPAFVPIDPKDEISPTRIAIESEADGDAYVLSQLARIHGAASGSKAVASPQELEAMRSGKATVATLGRNPLLWVQPKITQGNAGHHRIPYFYTVAIDAAYTPLDRATIVQPSRREAVEEDSAERVQKRPLDEVDGAEEKEDVKRAKEEAPAEEIADFED